MGTLSCEIVAEKLDLLLQELGHRRWQQPLQMGDIAVLLRSRTRLSSEVAHAAVTAGFLIQQSSVFILTAKGVKETKRLAFGAHSESPEPDSESPESRHSRAPKFPVPIRIEHGNRTLRTLMTSYGASEEQVLRAFAKGTQAALYFDREWLRQNNTYQRLRAAGEL